MTPERIETIVDRSISVGSMFAGNLVGSVIPILVLGVDIPADAGEALAGALRAVSALYRLRETSDRDAYDAALYERLACDAENATRLDGVARWMALRSVCAEFYGRVCERCPPDDAGGVALARALRETSPEAFLLAFNTPELFPATRPASMTGTASRPTYHGCRPRGR
jgi:hypothetical protein